MTQARLPAAVIGREELLAALAALPDSDPPAMLLRGDPGIGKSTLLAAAVADLRAAGVQVARGHGVESESDLPFAGLHQLLNPLRGKLSELGDVDRTALRQALGLDTSATVDRFAVFRGTLALLEKAAEQHPLVVVVDDLQWMDLSTREVLGFVGRRLTGSAICAVFAARPEEEFAEFAGIPVLQVPPLLADAADLLLRGLHPDLAPALRLRVLAEAEGNPLALEELPEAWTRHLLGDPSDPDSTAPLTQRLETLFARRVAALPSTARDGLLLAALDGGGPDSMLARQADHWELRAAARLGLIEDNGPTGGAPSFRHPLVRSAIIGLASASERRAAHLRLAELYAAQPERAVRHRAAGTVEPDEAVASALTASARLSSTRGAAASAVAVLVRAAELSVEPALAAARLSEASYVAAQTGRLDLADDLAERSRRRAGNAGPPPRSLTTEAFLMIYRHGDLRTAFHVTTSALRTAGAGMDSDQLSELICTLIIACMYRQDTGWWAEADQLIIPLLDRCDSWVRLVHDGCGDIARTGPGLRDRIRDELTHLPADVPPWLLSRLVLCAGHVDAFAEHRRFIRRLADGESHGGAIANHITGLIFTTCDAFNSGRWEEAERAAELAEQLAAQHEFRALEMNAVTYRGLLLASAGRLTPARELAARLRGWSTPHEVQRFVVYAAQIEALCASAEQDFESAYRTLVSFHRPGDFPPFVIHPPRLVFDLVEAAVRTGRLEEARRHVEAAEAADLGRGWSRCTLTVAGARALVSPDEQYDNDFQAAIGSADASEFPLELARIQLAYGERLRRQARLGPAREQLRQALDSFQALGAITFRARAESELRAAGVAAEPARSSDASAVTSHRDIDGIATRFGLTAQEARIAVLAASGLSNKQIGEQLYLSSRTVGSHLYKVFPKLGVTTRASLRDALDR